jgi:thiamine biosynthesis protein ThiI
MKLVALVSSGIDSPVASYLLAPKATEMILVHADNRPYAEEREIEKFLTLAAYLKKILPTKVRAFIVPHGNTLDRYIKHADRKFTCVFCKRMMLRYAEAIAHGERAQAIVMGDSLGQVASQTLQNIRVVEQAIALPVLRPLLGFDKEDTIKIARKIGTFELSIAPAGGCAAVPVKPSTRARLEQILDEEKKVDVDELVRQAVAHKTLVTV